MIASSNGRGLIDLQISSAPFNLPARAHIVRIGEEKVLSLPYFAFTAFSKCSGSPLPAFFMSHISVSAIVFLYSGELAAREKAAQQSIVVLILLMLSGVSPQPPSLFELSQSHFSPRWICVWFSFSSTIAKAKTAVAVESALLDKYPFQKPCGVLDPSKCLSSLRRLFSKVFLSMSIVIFRDAPEPAAHNRCIRNQ